MFEPHPDLTPGVIFGLGWLYFILFAMNAWWTVRVFRRESHFKMPDGLGGQEVPTAGFWALYSVLLLLVAIAHLTMYDRPESFQIHLPYGLRAWADSILGSGRWGPVLYFAGSVILFAAAIWLRRWLVRPTVAWVILNVTVVGMALAMTDYDFRQIVGKPDNVPIVSMLFIVGFFTWLYFKRSVENDERMAQGRPVLEAEENDQVLVWPDLVYTELICMVVLTAVLVVWGIVLQAPLEEPANSAKTPNPSKAPWYFLGLQEMLVYYDPWLAGVVFPSMIILGLMAIPYIDFNSKGNGYYTFKERKFAVSMFMFGFLPLWVAMIILGTFLRGPNWNIFGIFEFWDVHKLEVLENVYLSHMFWNDWLGRPLPESILIRELPGIVAIVAYFGLLPGLLAATVFRDFFMRMGFVRYFVFVNLVLMMAALPVKMVLRWSINLKYIVAIPEYFFNI